MSKQLGASDTHTNFKLEKWASVFQPSWETVQMDLDGGNPSKMAEFYHSITMINILEAADTDRQLGVTENSDIGVALAATTVHSLPWVDADKNMVWPFQKEWLDAYNVWNLNYIMTFRSLHLPPKLLIPSILCTSNEDVLDRM